MKSPLNTMKSPLNTMKSPLNTMKSPFSMVKSQVLHPAQLADAPSMALAKTEVTSSPLFTLPKTPASRQQASIGVE